MPGPFVLPPPLVLCGYGVRCNALYVLRSVGLPLPASWDGMDEHQVRLAVHLNLRATPSRASHPVLIERHSGTRVNHHQPNLFQVFRFVYSIQLHFPWLVFVDLLLEGERIGRIELT